MLNQLSDQTWSNYINDICILMRITIFFLSWSWCITHNDMFDGGDGFNDDDDDNVDKNGKSGWCECFDECM